VAAVERFPELDFTSVHGKAQRAVMERLGTGGRLSVAIGVAGSGKSTLLKPLVDAWKEDGRKSTASPWRGVSRTISPKPHHRQDARRSRVF